MTLTPEDRAGIVDLQARYVVALDTRDVEAVAELFLPEARFETHDHAFVGPDGIRKMLRHAPHGMHLGGHSVLEASEFGATAREQLVFIDATDHSLRLAVYDDELVRVGERWRFQRRVCRFMRADGDLHSNP